jgi:hypothetical protein
MVLCKVGLYHRAQELPQEGNASLILTVVFDPQFGCNTLTCSPYSQNAAVKFLSESSLE